MGKRRNFLFLSIAVALATCVVMLPAAEEPAVPQPGQKTIERANTTVFMRAKLASAQRVLEGLVKEDFRAIKQGADEMKKMSEAAEWPRARDKVYEHYSEEFRRQCNKLSKLAAAENLEAAHFTYLHIATTCVDCHNYVRGSLRVAHDAQNPTGPVQLIPSEWENVPTGGRDTRTLRR